MRSCPERTRAAGESGQAIIEFVLALPVLALLMGAAFNGWNSMEMSVGLTSAARAGAIQAANDLGANKTQQQAWNDATTAINAEEGQTTRYQNVNPSAGNYVNLTINPSESTTGGTVMKTVKITITTTPVALIPFVHSLSITASATARYA
jgi:Flp pilus assembly protein TadG